MTAASGLDDEAQVRQATPADAVAIAPLLAQYRVFYGQPHDEELAGRYLGERLARAESTVLLAEQAGRALGFVQLFPTFSSVAAARVWILEDLFVAEEARGRGIGRALLQAAETAARSAGVAQLQLATAVDNTGAQRLYRAQGYAVDDRFLHYEKNLGG